MDFFIILDEKCVEPRLLIIPIGKGWAKVQYDFKLYGEYFRLKKLLSPFLRVDNFKDFTSGI